MSKLLKLFGSKYLPAFPPKDFYENISPEDFILSLLEQEITELMRIRDIIRPHLSDIPTKHLIVSEQVKYLINKNIEGPSQAQREANLEESNKLQNLKWTPETLKRFSERHG